MSERKWEKKDEVGKLGPGEMFNEGGMIYFEDLFPKVQAAIQSEANLRKAAKEMDEICYAVLDCFTPTTKEQEKWLAERKAEYAEAHQKIVS